MNNEFKYGVTGLLMAICFFGALQLISFIILISSKSQIQNDVGTSGTGTNQSSTIKNTKGKELFSSNCASCHAVHKNLTGPALAGVEDRVPDKKVLYEWIRNSQKILQSGNPYFVNLYNSFNKTAMNQFPNLSDEDIDNILEYIKE